MDVTERVKYRDPIEQFPDKMDQLLAAFHRVRNANRLSLISTLSSSVAIRRPAELSRETNASGQ